MAVEIERKFLVSRDGWRTGKPTGVRFCQGYLVEGDASTKVRIRREYLIPVQDAEELLRLCHKPLIEKLRYSVPFAGHTWSIDVVCGSNPGLVLAEIELRHTDEEFEKPPWLGREVTGNRRYSNATLRILPVLASSNGKVVA